MRLNLNKPSHIMLTWAALTVSGAFFYTVTKNGIYVRRREQAVPPPVATKGDMTWEERIAKDEENAAKKGYKVNYRDIHETAKEESTTD
ncbi:hypothetical protein BGZ82_002452 [Podila clonocystis]|nr:hypothetical protein BGZ82_002452 [Podila clonocystis]